MMEQVQEEGQEEGGLMVVLPNESEEEKEQNESDLMDTNKGQQQKQQQSSSSPTSTTNHPNNNFNDPPPSSILNSSLTPPTITTTAAGRAAAEAQRLRTIHTPLSITSHDTNEYEFGAHSNFDDTDLSVDTKSSQALSVADTLHRSNRSNRRMNTKTNSTKSKQQQLQQQLQQKVSGVFGIGSNTNNKNLKPKQNNDDEIAFHLSKEQYLQSIFLAEDAARRGQSSFSTKDYLHNGGTNGEMTQPNNLTESFSKLGQWLTKTVNGGGSNDDSSNGGAGSSNNNMMAITGRTGTKMFSMPRRKK